MHVCHLKYVPWHASSRLLRTQTEKPEWQNGMRWWHTLAQGCTAVGVGQRLGPWHFCWFTVLSFSSAFLLRSHFGLCLPLSSFLCSLGCVNSVLSQLQWCVEALNYSTALQAKGTCFLLRKHWGGDRQRSATKLVLVTGFLLSAPTQNSLRIFLPVETWLIVISFWCYIHHFSAKEPCVLMFQIICSKSTDSFFWKKLKYIRKNCSHI